MAGINIAAITSEVALSAATAKTVVQMTAAANQPIRVYRWGVFFDGTSTTAEPVQIVLMRQSTAGTMTSLTPTKVSNHGETVQTAAQHTATAEPTSGDVLDMVEVHPQSGYEYIAPLGYEFEVPGGGRIGIVCTAPAGVNVRAKLFALE
jgi:hypothetical protein